MDINNVKKDKPGPTKSGAFNVVAFFAISIAIVIIISLATKNNEPKSNTFVSPPKATVPSTDVNKSSSPESVKKPETPPSPPTPTFKVGDTVTAGKFDVVVSEYKAANEVKTSYSLVKTENQFVIVKVKVTNKDDRARDVGSSMFTLVDAEGKTYAKYDKTIMGEEYLSYETINPGISRSRSIVFETPKDISVAKLRIDSGVALAGGQHVDVDLNAK